MRQLVVRLAGNGAFDHLNEVIVSAGGSAYFDSVVEHLTSFDIDRSVRTVLRSGCYVTHGTEMYPAHLAARCTRYGTNSSAARLRNMGRRLVTTRTDPCDRGHG